jgi:hypothetical protein
MAIAATHLEKLANPAQAAPSHNPAFTRMRWDAGEKEITLAEIRTLNPTELSELESIARGRLQSLERGPTLEARYYNKRHRMLERLIERIRKAQGEGMKNEPAHARAIRLAQTIPSDIEVKRTVITPGGRVGDNARLNLSPKKNWVENSKPGALPEYIRIIRNGLMKDGHDEGRATALAVAAVKRWARGGDNVRPQVRAAAAKAVAEWEAMKAGK